MGEKPRLADILDTEGTARLTDQLCDGVTIRPGGAHTLGATPNPIGISLVVAILQTWVAGEYGGRKQHDRGES